MVRGFVVVLVSLLFARSAFAQCDLRRHSYVPAGLQPMAPLVVVLHGCAQTAAQVAADSAWNQLADRHGFAVLYPEQQRCANPLGCFNWFDPQHTTRGRGEAHAIKAWVDELKAQHNLDPARIHVAGFSAGAAMTTALLACYPEVFADRLLAIRSALASSAPAPELPPAAPSDSR